MWERNLFACEFAIQQMNLWIDKATSFVFVTVIPIWSTSNLDSQFFKLKTMFFIFFYHYCIGMSRAASSQDVSSRQLKRRAFNLMIKPLKRRTKRRENIKLNKKHRTEARALRKRKQRASKDPRTRPHRSKSSMCKLVK